MRPAAKASPLNDLKSSYDIIVLGGGIQGATLSWMAACHGYSVVLIEQNDFGSGVSANSLKIIHGGIRYLQGLDFFRMRRSMGERRMLLQLAPLLVHPMRCVLPAYGGGRGKGRLALALGSMIYDILTIDRNKGLEPAKRIRRSRVLSPGQIKKLLAGLDHSETAGGISWWDAMVYDSERLVLGFVMSARQNGADVCNHVRAEEILTADGRVQGVIAGDLLTGDRLELHGRVVMDCTGPWSALGGSKPDQHYAKAMNLLLQKPLASCAFGARSKKKSDGMLFFVPWKNGTIAGTWYSHADKTSDPGTLSITLPEIESALEDVNSAFSQPVAGVKDITAVHLGLLPALAGPGKAAAPVLKNRFSITDGAAQGAAGFIGVQGIKYTTARKVSARALELAGRYLDAKPGSSGFRPARLYGNDTAEIEKFRRSCILRYGAQFSESAVTRLMDNYGTHIHAILAYVKSEPELGLTVPGTADVLCAELAFAIDNEIVRTLADLIFRRTDLGGFSMPAPETIAFCADFAAKRLGWDAPTRDENIRALGRQLPMWLHAEAFNQRADAS